ncbi:phage terminase small subunit [Nocardiopsis salina]|uniref:phage terminase small subunit n=1 Tax=Nocardiopsis salina TaxID=245836 RepID=UPI000347E864|nr:hypothetical protein [Nocardiopsis salina]
MASGGARAVSGPPPDPNALRRNRKQDASGWATLPAEGRTGPVPGWPLTEVRPREWDLWRELWSRPQAVMWESLGLDIEVALFARALAEAEEPEPRADAAKLTKQYMESLGLTAPGLLRLRWKVGPTEDAPAAEPVEPSKAKTPRRKSARDRLKVVSDGEGA